METLSLLARLSKDVRLTSRELSVMKRAAWWICITSCNTNGLPCGPDSRDQSGADEPETTNVLSFFQSQVETLENQIRAALGEYAQKFVAGRWAQSIVGIGPVISAGLLCHIDIERAKHASQVGGTPESLGHLLTCGWARMGPKKFVVELGRDGGRRCGRSGISA